MKQRALIVILGIIAVIAMIWYVGPRNSDLGESWNLSSTRPSGAKALADLYRALGMPITTRATLPDTPGAPVLIVSDYYSDEQIEQIVEYARKGGTVVQFTGDHLFRSGSSGASTFEVNPIGVKKSCDWPELADVDLVRLEEAELFERVGRGEFCFKRGDYAWLMRETVGKGKIYTLGNGMAFVNKLIEADDNAVLAVRLLEEDGREYGEIIHYQPVNLPQQAEIDLLELVPGWFWVATIQLAIAGSALVYWRLIRPSRVIRETLMTQLPGSTPVLAFGHYLWSTKRIGAVADMARQDCRTRMAAKLAISESESITLIEVVAQAAQLPKEHVEYVLFGPAPTDRSELFELTLKIAELDHAIAAGPRSTTT